MNIKQAETLSGVTRQNIRFYEKQGLLTPARNRENDYREYGDADIQALKWIRAMRMLDMPLEDIRQVLTGNLELGCAAQNQQRRLEEQVEKLEGAIRFCGTLQGSTLAQVDVDSCLAKMEQEDAGFFQQWKQDFLAVYNAEIQRAFTFFPEDPVTCSAEFTNALFAYASQEDLDLVITREGMHPVFTIDGIEYTAYHDYRWVGRACPTGAVHCEMTHPEEYLPPVPEKRQKKMQALIYILPGAILFSLLLMMVVIGFLRTGAAPLADILVAILILTFVGILIASLSYTSWWFHFRNQK